MFDAIINYNLPHAKLRKGFVFYFVPSMTLILCFLEYQKNIIL